MRRVSLLDCYADRKVLLFVFQISFCSVITPTSLLTSRASAPLWSIPGIPNAAPLWRTCWTCCLINLKWKKNAQDFKQLIKKKNLNSCFQKLDFFFMHEVITPVIKMNGESLASLALLVHVSTGLGGSVLAWHWNNQLWSSQQKWQDQTDFPALKMMLYLWEQSTWNMVFPWRLHFPFLLPLPRLVLPLSSAEK